MSEYILESDMKFGPFEREKLFHIEKCLQYQTLQNGMHISEFIYYNEQKKQIISLEAKKSAPNPNSDKVDDPKQVLEDYINTIREKFENSLDLYVNLALKGETPTGFTDIDYHKVEIVFVLVIKEQKKEWLKDVKDALEMSVRKVLRTNRIWKCRVAVINEEMAIKAKIAEA